MIRKIVVFIVLSLVFISCNSSEKENEHDIEYYTTFVDDPFSEKDRLGNILNLRSDVKYWEFIHKQPLDSILYQSSIAGGPVFYNYEVIIKYDQDLTLPNQLPLPTYEEDNTINVNAEDTTWYEGKSYAFTIPMKDGIYDQINFNTEEGGGSVDSDTVDIMTETLVYDKELRVLRYNLFLVIAGKVDFSERVAALSNGSEEAFITTFRKDVTKELKSRNYYSKFHYIIDDVGQFYLDQGYNSSAVQKGITLSKESIEEYPRVTTKGVAIDAFTQISRAIVHNAENGDYEMYTKVSEEGSDFTHQRGYQK